jgi:hypothetical protein
MRRRNVDQGALTRELAMLPTLSSDALKERWQALYGSPPPVRIGRGLMIKAIAYRLQENALGKIKPATGRMLARASEALSDGGPLTPVSSAKPGTRLLREWQGVTHEVIVMEEGVRYRDKTWAPSPRWPAPSPEPAGRAPPSGVATFSGE